MNKELENKINDKLNEVFNKYAYCDTPMWCDLAQHGTACLVWHKYQDSSITKSQFRTCAIIIFSEFKDIDTVWSCWWTWSRKELMNIIKRSRKMIATKEV